ncbi:MAG TPA: NAD(P)-dependent alcohol dehydrogenase [Steroidobacteraceae bacterium]|nr:NAD(P)-dependent alcohol dehydrogenase [Steroidobacteraceae bacterium]
MLEAHGYAAAEARARLAPFRFQRRDALDQDVVLQLLHCGICHSDLHFVNNDWGFTRFPVVPGHEIVGRVISAGNNVDKFKVGDLAAIGCLVDSCRRCSPCQVGEEQFCVERPTATYNATERGSSLPTFGGYSNNYVVDQRFALKLSPALDPAAAAPLLCAGITTYSPLRHWKVGPGQKIGVVGLGGLGHIAIKIARAMGAYTVAFTTSPSKFEDARRVGAHEVVLSTDADQMRRQAGSFDFLLDTVSASHDVNALVAMLKRDCTLAMIGMPAQPLAVSAMGLAAGRRSIASSMIGGLRETQEMLDFCATHRIAADIERIEIQQVNEALSRLQRNDVKYRFVIDLASLNA